MVRPTALTPEITGQIVELLLQGATVEALCGIVGISTTTYYRWRSEGQAEDAGLKREFYEATKAAMGEWELHHIKNVKDSKWILTHHPFTKARWAEMKEVTTHEGKRLDVKGELERNLALCDDEQDGEGTLQGEPQDTPAI